MTTLPRSLQKLINEFSKLPGIGPKSAQRLAFYLLKKDKIDTELLSEAISSLQSGITYCDKCHNMAETNPCSVCIDPSRNQTLLCVVEEPFDALALDRTGQYKGLFHVLGGVLNPLEGIGPDQLMMESLLNRLESGSIIELIIATNPTLEGETTAMHIAKITKELPIKITRIARGLPMGGDLEYADEITLSRALDGRREY